MLLLNERDKLQILDVREAGEGPVVEELAGIQIPLGDVLEQSDKISKGKQVVVICKSGIRSKRSIELLQEKYGFNNLYNLEGGVLEWLKASINK